MEIPPYINIKRDSMSSPIILSVEDALVRHQREMWGEQDDGSSSPKH